MSVEYKICHKCKASKSPEDFRKGPNGNPTSPCMDCKRLQDREYGTRIRRDNPDIFRATQRAWYGRNKEKANMKSLAAANKRYKSDSDFRLLKILRSRMSKAVTRGDKSMSSIGLTGCSIEQLREWLEAQFEPEMSWSNHGVRGWHIDHIKPCVKFDLSDPVQQRECFHFSNLQPLWWEDNKSKYDKFEEAA
jgi:hypothetical protein